MPQTVGDFLVKRLHDWGVRFVFGYSGDGINGVFGALNRADGKLEFIQARHEEMAAIAAKYACPERPVIALVGDGAMQMNNMAELITVAKYWREWADHHWIVCVFNNEDLNQVTWEQRIINGDPKFEASQRIQTSPSPGLPR
jgi:thiamine pyrophosphate-dependent acetolactate synthase large subunit-like protein